MIFNKIQSESLIQKNRDAQNCYLVLLGASSSFCLGIEKGAVVIKHINKERKKKHKNKSLGRVRKKKRVPAINQSNAVLLHDMIERKCETKSSGWVSARVRGDNQ